MPVTENAISENLIPRTAVKVGKFIYVMLR